MMREVAYGIMSIILVGFLLYYMTPLLVTLKDAGMQSVDLSDPVNANYFELGDGLYVILGLSVFGVVAFLLLSYSTRNQQV